MTAVARFGMGAFFSFAFFSYSIMDVSKPQCSSTPKIDPDKVGPCEAGSVEIGSNMSMLFSPLVPRLHSLFEDVKMLLIRHTVSSLQAALFLSLIRPHARC